MLSIVTPSLCRDSLIRTCESVDSQQYGPYEHIVVFDGRECLSGRERIISSILKNPKRRIITLETRVNDFGNTPRRMGSMTASGHYVMYIDDDDYYLPNAFLMIDAWLADKEPKPAWCVFPAKRYGALFFAWPPAICQTVSCQFLHANRINGNKILWPNDDQSYVSDGKFIESLKSLANPHKMDTGEPLVCVDKSSGGH